MDRHRQIAPHTGRRRPRRTGAVIAALALGFGACSTAGEPETSTPDADRSLPAGWESEQVPDRQTRPFTLGVPEDAEVWAVGSPLAPLGELTSGTDWWAFWEPRLASVEPETSNVRAMVVVPDDDGEVRSLQVNVNPYDLDVEADDAQGIAEALALVAEAQGNEVTATRTVPYDGPEVDEVGEIAFSVDPALLARDVRQRFYPVPSENALWSVQCDGPSGADLQVVCDEALDAFRPPVVDGD